MQTQELTIHTNWNCLNYGKFLTRHVRLYYGHAQKMRYTILVLLKLSSTKHMEINVHKYANETSLKQQKLTCIVMHA